MRRVRPVAFTGGRRATTKKQLKPRKEPTQERSRPTVAVLLEEATRRTPYVRDQVVSALNTKFASQVELDMLQVTSFPRPEVRGGGLTLRYNGRTDVPPLISVASFSASAGLAGVRPLRATA